MKRILAAILSAIFFVGCAGGCARSQSGSGQPAQEALPQPTSQAASRPEQQGSLTLMLPPGQTALASVLDTVVSAEGHTLQVETGSEADYQLSLRRRLEESGGPDLFWVEGEKQAWQLLGEDFIPFEDLAGSGSSSLMQALADMVPADSRLLQADSVYGLPVGFYAQGYLVNLPVITALLGSDDEDAVLHDLTQATYEQWGAMAAALASFLEHPQKLEIQLGTTTYVTPRYRPESAQAVRGIFAVGTGEAKDYFQNTLSAVYGAAFGSAADLLQSTEQERGALLSDPLGAALDLLYAETLFMTQESGLYRRGEDFLDTQRLTVQQAEELFTSGAALFMHSSSARGLELEQQNPDIKNSLALVPTKLPVRVHLAEGEEQLLYQEYAYSQQGYLCINPDSRKKDAAAAVLLRLFTSDQGQALLTEKLYLLPFTQLYPGERIHRQLAGALAGGEAYQIPADAQLLESQQRRLGEWVLLQLMSKEEWDESDDESFLSTAVGYLAVLAAEEGES